MKENIKNLIRPNIQALKPYASARDEFTGKGEVFLDANENPFETGLNRYPDPYQRGIKAKLSLLKGVGVNEIFLGNGSDEAIDLIIRIFCEPGKDNILVPDPSYGMYEVSAAINNVAVKKIPLTDKFEYLAAPMLDIANDHSKVAFLCSPNNPSGNILDPYRVESFIQSFKGIVVVDEAYIDFSSSASYLEKLNEHENLIVLQTFSKAWGLAGIRLGMAFASVDIIKLFNKVKPPYNINVLTQKEVMKALDHPERVLANINTILKQRSWLQKELNALEVTEEIFPSDSNFLLVRFTGADELFHYLIRHEIILRNRSKVRHSKDCLRITVGTEEENQQLIAAIKTYMK